MVIHPSGTDAETMPLLQAVLESRHLARTGLTTASFAGRPKQFSDDPTRGNVVSLVACAGEVGSGTTEAAMGRFFSKSVPLGGNHVAMGQELPALHELADMDAVELVARGGPDALDGGARLDYDELIFAAARKALAADPACVVVLHTVAGSKTGLRLPSPVVADTLKREFGNRIVSVLDACQMRHHPELIPRWLDEQGTAGRGFPKSGGTVSSPSVTVLSALLLTFTVLLQTQHISQVDCLPIPLRLKTDLFRSHRRPGFDDLLQVFRRSVIWQRRVFPARRYVLRVSQIPNLFAHTGLTLSLLGISRGPHERPPGRGGPENISRARGGVRVVPHAPRHRRRPAKAARRHAPRVLQRRRVTAVGRWVARDGNAAVGD